MRWIPIVVLAASLSLAACAPVLTVGCAVWGSKFQPDEGFKDRWTVGEKRQAVRHNRKVERYCR